MANGYNGTRGETRFYYMNIANFGNLCRSIRVEIATVATVTIVATIESVFVGDLRNVLAIIMATMAIGEQ